MIERPDATEYAEYFGRYIDLVPEGDIASVLDRSLQATLELLDRVPKEIEEYRYAPEKWSVREVVGHLIDVERVFAYRALAFARRDPARLPTMEENDYARASNAHRRSLRDLGEEFATVRRSSISLFRSFSDQMARSTGVASGNEFSVRSIAFIIAGHEIHHRRVLQERYLAVALGSGESIP